MRPKLDTFDGEADDQRLDRTGCIAIHDSETACHLQHGSHRSRRITNTWLNIRKLYWPITSDTVPTPQECGSALDRGLGVDHGGLTVALAAKLDLTCG